MEAVEMLLDKLQQLQLHQHKILIEGWRKDMNNLEENLHLVKAFLKDSTKKQRKDESHRELVLQIRNVVYETDDIIDAYVARVAEYNSKSYFRKVFSKSINPDGVGQRIQSLCDGIVRYSDDSSWLSTSDVSHRKSIKLQRPPITDNLVVDLKEEREEVISYLTKESRELDVITIVGMPGIGKTALAWKTYTDDRVRYEFPIRIWINVSNEFSEKEVFLAILKHLTLRTDDIDGKDEVELAKLVANYLEKEKFLIVMDDVVSARDWDRLRIVLPNYNEKGKVLITSCNENVGLYANRYRLPFRVRFLTQSESWSLLRSEVFGDLECPPELENIGRLIAEQCGGLPLAILAMARTLMEENLSSSTMTEKRMRWTKVCSCVPRDISNIFYLNLPYDLQMCFLYFGMFPSDFEIPVWKLIRMWIAEGFIQQRETISLEETAEYYLEDLIERNLVIVDKIKRNGKIKSCRIHGMLHEYCKIEAGKERVLQQVQFSDGVFDPPVSDLSDCQRLCITSNILGFLSSKPIGPRVRSFVAFSLDKVCLSPENNSAIPEAFKLLRVLDVPIKFTRIPGNMYRLIHLRFLVLSLDSPILPANFSNLWNIQTLIVDTTSRTLEIKADIWQFTQLRHLKTNARTTLATANKHGTHGRNLQTLAQVSPASCTEEFFARACNLKKTGIRGKLSLFLDGKIGSFDSLGKMTSLENLKLVNDVFPLPPSECRLPLAYKFPSSLRSLTLAHTHLDWSQMGILRSLQRLEVLKLKDHAFVGRNWVAEDGGFDSLEALYIGRTDLVIWVASAHHFPRLASLELHRCEELRKVPIQLADIPTLQRLELFHTKLAAASAIRIGDEIKRHKREQGPRRNSAEFKLVIYPPIE